jgi:hypothetical protein
LNACMTRTSHNQVCTILVHEHTGCELIRVNKAEEKEVGGDG